MRKRERHRLCPTARSVPSREQRREGLAPRKQQKMIQNGLSNRQDPIHLRAAPRSGAALTQSTPLVDRSTSNTYLGLGRKGGYKGGTGFGLTGKCNGPPENDKNSTIVTGSLNRTWRHRSHRFPVSRSDFSNFGHALINELSNDIQYLWRPHPITTHWKRCYHYTHQVRQDE